MTRFRRHRLSLVLVIAGVILALVVLGRVPGGYAVGQAADGQGEAPEQVSSPGGDSSAAPADEPGTPPAGDGALLPAADPSGTDPSPDGDSKPLPPAEPGDTTPPAAPEGLAVENPGTGTELRLSWQPNTEGDLLGYRIYRADKEGGGYVRLGQGDVDTHEPFYIDATVSRNEEYWYYVTAVDQALNESGPSASVHERALDITPPAPPREVDLEELDTGQHLRLTWAPNTEDDLHAYLVYRSSSPDGPFALVDTVGKDQTAFLDGGLVQGQWYYYYVTAQDTSGNESGPSAVVRAKPRQAVRIKVNQSGAQTPAAVFVSPDSTAVFLNKPGDRIILRAKAVGADGSAVPVAGTWRFAADFGSFEKARETGVGEAEGYFKANELGGGEIAAEFYPEGAKKPVASASVSVRALEWHIFFNVSDRRAAAGSEDVVLTAQVVDGQGNAVTDPAARVRFEPMGQKRARDEERKRPKVGRWHGDAHVTTIENGQKTGVPEGPPGPDGQVEARLIAGTVPGEDPVRAVLLYDDFSGAWGQPKVVEVDGPVRVEVVPGAARYVGWEPEAVVVDGKKPVSAQLVARDAFGNRTEDLGTLRVWVQVPGGVPLEISFDDGKTWTAAGNWVKVAPGQKVEVRAAPAAQEVPAGTYLVTTRVEGLEAGPTANLPQANLPLAVSVPQAIKSEPPEANWTEEITGFFTRLASALLSLVERVVG